MDECADLLAHPELSADQLRELYCAKCQGVDIKDMFGMTPSQIRIASVETPWNEEDTKLTPTQIKQIDYELFDKALRFVARRKGLLTI